MAESRLKTDDHVWMVSGNKRKLISCAHIRALSARGKLDNFPWKFESEKAKQIYVEWLAEKRESEKARQQGTTLPPVAGLTNEKPAGEGMAKKPSEPKNETEEKAPEPNVAPKREVGIRDALKNDSEDK